MTKKFTLIFLLLSSVSSFAFTDQCKTELQKHCPTAKDEPTRYACVAKVKKSPECEKGLADYMKTQGPCSSDVAKFCPEAKNFDALANSHCLLGNRIKLSPACFADVSKTAKKYQDEQEQSELEFQTICKEDLTKACGSVKPASYKCFRQALAANKVESKKCKEYAKSFSAKWKKKVEKI